MDTLFFWASKLVWMVIAPGNFLLILLVAGCVLLFIGKIHLARILLSASCIVLVVISLFAPHTFLLYPLDTRFQTNPPLPDHLDGIIVLGGSEDAHKSEMWNQVSLSENAERHLAFMALARQYPNARLVFTGGGGSLAGGDEREADVARSLYAQQGIDVDRVTFERESRNTYENVILSRALVQPGENETWLLITTAWHMPRSVGIFCKHDWPVIPYPVDHASVPGERLVIHFSLANNLRNLNIAIHEWVGLIVYYLTGKTSKLFPAGCD